MINPLGFGVLVRYHGSLEDRHGVYEISGTCLDNRAGTCRYHLAPVGAGTLIRHVRPTSITPLTAAEIAEYTAEERIRAEIAEVDPDGFSGDAARWTPDLPVVP
ncbi:hypothetical protein [Actinomadura rupiterrae]|uniref:hypothetical protein n=1 Tax=Actinomadura rupiterrae TaxID=559627 RepID=UPI0020A5C341|nr:hypothetical protein [Actinomadura rupiterrae]MCP2339183.1 hypothetical protein [Actinomadura rupiterrae]